MKHLKKFENMPKRKADFKKVNLELIDFDKIQEDFLNKFNEIGLEPNIDNIYADVQLLKTDKLNSFIFHIVKNNLRNMDFSLNFQNIMQTSAKFFDVKYGEVIKKFKEDKKKEFALAKKTAKNGFTSLLDPDTNEMVTMPGRIGHNYIPIKILPMEELQTKHSRHKRLKTFAKKGLKCVRCERVGKYLIAGQDKGGQIHLDIYTKDFELMTVDHIKPKSKGGTYDIDNLDPMCCFCNTAKSNKWEEVNEETIEVNIE